MANIVHLTSVHPRYDTRIFVKQCRSLRAMGHDVTLVVADGLGNEYIDGIRIVDVGRLSGRLNRMLRTTRRVLRAARLLDADAYQLHDPELLPVGLSLRRLGKHVVFDSHEDVPTQILSKPYLGRLTRRVLSSAFAAYQRHACLRFDGVIGAQPLTTAPLARFHPHAVTVNNFALLDEFDTVPAWDAKAQQVCYVGNISALRGIRELVQACGLLQSPARLALAGSFDDPALEREVMGAPGWSRVDAHGHIDRAGVAGVMRGSMAGLVTLQPAPNYLEALPVKMFEYMAAGLPVISSRFPLWQDIVEGNDCGVCVEPHDPAAIAAAIDYFCTHPDEARRMGENGRRAVFAKYNWASEAAVLAAFYDRVLGTNRTGRTGRARAPQPVCSQPQ